MVAESAETVKQTKLTVRDSELCCDSETDRRIRQNQVDRAAQKPKKIKALWMMKLTPKYAECQSPE